MHSMETRNSSDRLRREPSETQLEIANQRLLTFMKALHIPVRTRYELAAQALALAAEADGPAEHDFIAAAMRHLEKILAMTALGGLRQELGGLQPMPPLNRGAMIPVNMERSGPIAFFFSVFINAVKRLLRPPLRLYFLLLVLMALAALYWWLEKV
jgi:hypothetical protein